MLAVLARLDQGARWSFFSNLGTAYVIAHQRRPGVHRLRRAGAEALQVRRRRARRRRAVARRAAATPKGDAGVAVTQARLRPALRAASRTASSRRAPAAASPSRPRATRSSASRRCRATRTSSCVVTERRARAASARPTRCTELANPGRGVTVIKVERRRRVVGFGVGRAKDKDVAHRSRPTKRQEADRRPGPFHGRPSRGGKGHAARSARRRSRA